MKPAWIFRIIIWCALLAALVSAGFAFHSWWVNPSGIFHSPETGTQWSVVWETFFSWFWPLLPTVVFPGLLIGWLSGRKQQSD